MSNISQLYMSTQDACKRYSISRTTLYSLFQLDECPLIRKLSNRVLIPVKEFDEFFESVLGVPENFRGGEKRA